MPNDEETITRFLDSADFTRAEKDFIVNNQFNQGSHFDRCLYGLIFVADEGNCEKLAKGFPDEVGAVKEWTRGDLGKRCREFGLDV